MSTLILRQFIIGHNTDGTHKIPTWITAKIETTPKGERLSITAVEGPTRNGNCWGSCGQAMTPPTELVPGIDAARLYAIWERWHLNDTRPGCEHQRSWDMTRKVEVVTYKLTTKAYYVRQKLIEASARAAAKGDALQLSPEEKALILLEDWHAARYAKPEGALADYYELDKTETKAIGWVYPTEHPDGLLCKPCPECGYKYGTAWLFEPLPADVIDFITALPHSDAHPWGQR